MKSERERHKTTLGVILATVLATLLVACAAQEDELEVADLDGEFGLDELDLGDDDSELGAAELAQSDPQAQRVLAVAPPAPDGAATTMAGDGKPAESILVASPTISPSNSAPGADYEYADPGETYSCASGTLCTLVWDPNAGQWKIFKLYYCHTYALAHWEGSAFYWDNQTGNPKSIFYGQAMNKLFEFYPGGGQLEYRPGWHDVWYIKNC